MTKIESTLECIEQLMDKMVAKGITKLEIKDKDLEIKLESQKPESNKVVYGQLSPIQASAINDSAAAPSNQKAVTKGNVVKAPIVGTFYAASSPKEKPFVNVGQKVSKGDILFIIESMKVMNEVKSEFDGTVITINVKDGEAVEYDQPVMIIE